MHDEGGISNSNKMISKRSDKDSFNSSFPHAKLIEELAIEKSEPKKPATCLESLFSTDEEVKEKRITLWRL